MDYIIMVKSKKTVCKLDTKRSWDGRQHETSYGTRRNLTEEVQEDANNIYLFFKIFRYLRVVHLMSLFVHFHFTSMSFKVHLISLSYVSTSTIFYLTNTKHPTSYTIKSPSVYVLSITFCYQYLATEIRTHRFVFILFWYLLRVLWSKLK